jgi:hypothetical protein
MKLSDHVDIIRERIYKSFNNQFSRLGIGPNKLMEIDKIPADLHTKRNKIETLIASHEGETGTYEEAREKALDELTFTLFNRVAAIKVMEAHQLFAPIVTKQATHGGRSFGHKIWLENNPEKRNDDLEGLRDYFKYEFNKLGDAIPLFHKNYPYALLPYVIELNDIVDAFNAVEQDAQIEDNIWQSDDILGWLYESYNNVKKQTHKDSGAKTEYDKVSLQSQVYTPRWVVEFLVHNSLGKLYLEMHPDSEIKDLYKIANAPKTRVREMKPLHELKLIDPAAGSGNFLLYAFTFFYALYKDQIDNYGADYEDDDIPKLIIEHNLHGIDLDDRAAQLAQLGLWIKVKQKNRNIGALHFNVVSSDFYLPDFDFVYPIFKAGVTDAKQLSIVEEIWTDLQQAYKFGSLVKIEEKLSIKLHGLVDQKEITLFGEQDIVEYERFKKEFFNNLETAINRFAQGQGSSFLTDKTKDAITFLKLITQKYDVAIANPPYTDSADFGPELKKYIENNYKKPFAFHTNLYATFVKRSFELTNESGKIGVVHPTSFMYIKKFTGMREFILNNSYIDLLVEWGFLGMFNPKVRVDAAMYILDKIKLDSPSTFIKLDDIYEGKRYNAFVKVYDRLAKEGAADKNIYEINQSKLKNIETWPFNYWISSEFRELFNEKNFNSYFKLATGLMTGDNLKHLRYYWEIRDEDLSKNYIVDKKKWVPYQKGGDYNKWHGNNWLVVNYEESGTHLATTDNKKFYFQNGITYSATSARISFRMLPSNQIFDKKGSCIFPLEDGNEWDFNYVIALLNSKFSSYIIKSLNSTVETQIGDVKRVPFIKPSKEIENFIGNLAKRAIDIKRYLNQFYFLEKEYVKSILDVSDKNFKNVILTFLNKENHLLCQNLIIDNIINYQIFKLYNLSENDKNLIIEKEGLDLLDFPLCKLAKEDYLSNEVLDLPLDYIKEYINNLPEQEIEVSKKEAIENELPQLYLSNNDLEAFCIRHQINPINIFYWFKESKVIPKQRMNDLAMEFLADLLREILMEDDDGIIPLVPNAGEKVLLDRIEEKFIEKGFSMAQYSSFDSLLGRELNDYINYNFFKNFSDHLNLFQNLPKTPFIWHLTSGPEQGFDCYIIIYKWDRDKLLRIRSVYIEHRERALINRQTDLRNKAVLTASEQNEADKIYKQLKEIESFKTKIDELLQEGYTPILDDGVGKNIAPIQKKGMLAYEVLNAGQLKKYLNADW